MLPNVFELQEVACIVYERSSLNSIIEPRTKLRASKDPKVRSESEWSLGNKIAFGTLFAMFLMIGLDVNGIKSTQQVRISKD